MTKRERKAPVSTSGLHPWAVSFLLHALVLILFLPLFHPIAKESTEPFRLTIKLVDPSDLPITPFPSEDRQSAPAETVVALQPVSPLSPVPAIVESSALRSTITDMPPPPIVESVVPETIVEPTPTAIEPPILAAQQTSGQPAVLSDPDERLLTEEPPVTVASAPVTEAKGPPPPPSVSAQEPLDRPLDRPIVTAQSTLDTPSTEPLAMVASATPVTQPDRESLASTNHAKDQAPTPAVIAAPVAPSLSESPSRPVSSRADYGWLQRAVLQRLETLKRSSRPLLDDSRPLKVLVKAVISDAGELMETSVVKSSGLDRIDQEAIALVQRAFPMSLDHDLDRPEVIMRIPITYSRD